MKISLMLILGFVFLGAPTYESRAQSSLQMQSVLVKGLESACVKKQETEKIFKASFVSLACKCVAAKQTQLLMADKIFMDAIKRMDDAAWERQRELLSSSGKTLELTRECMMSSLQNVGGMRAAVMSGIDIDKKGISRNFLQQYESACYAAASHKGDAKNAYQKWCGCYVDGLGKNLSIAEAIENSAYDWFDLDSLKRRNAALAARFKSISDGCIPSQRESAEGKQQIHTIVARQDAEGLTESQMDLDMLKRLEQHVKVSVQQHANAYLESKSLPPITAAWRTNSAYVEKAGRKFGVVRLNADAVRAAYVFGVRGEDILIVACIGIDVPSLTISFGSCGDKIKETFGVGL